MTHLPPLLRREAMIALVLLVSMSCWSGASYAQSASASAPSLAQPELPGDTIRLTDEERKSLEAKNTIESAAAARDEMVGSDRAALGIHGEVGAMIGSNGTRGAFGTAAIPLGDHAGAVVSFESSRFGYRR